MQDKPDFSSYDYETLLDVYAHIDARKYPERRAEVAALLEQRKDAPETLEQQRQRLLQKRYDTFFQRLFASLLDGLILWVPTSMFAALMLSAPGPLATLLAVVGEVTVLAYYILFHWKTGQTIGKNVLAVRVVNNLSEQTISLKQAVIREILPLIVVAVAAVISLFVPGMHSLDGVAPGEPSRFQALAGSMVFFWVLLELITMLFHERNRSLHDLIAGTVVVNELPPKS